MIQAAELDLDSMAGNNPTKRSGSTRRSRAAEVHNLSERVGILDLITF
jgi:phytochrome-interacting factor 4